MKKLFIQLVCVVMLFSIFAPTLVFAQVIKQEEISWVNSKGQTVEAYKVFYKTGGHAIIYKQPGQNKWQVDAYTATDGKKDLGTVSGWQQGIAVGQQHINKLNGTTDQIKSESNPFVNNSVVNGIKSTRDLLAKGPSALIDPVVQGIMKGIKHGIYLATWAVAKLAGWITAVVGMIFDRLLTELTPTNEGHGTLAGINGSIESSWRIIRDVASIIIIFSLMYLGIKTILDGNGFADKKTLVSIIVAAILLNFSLLLVRDVAFFVSNRVGNEILQTAVLNNTSGGGSFSAAMLNMIGPQSLFKTQGSPTGISQEQFALQEWDVVFMFVIQVGILNFVLLIAVLIYVGLIILMLVRFIIFVILMITAPLGIIAFTIPWIKSHGKMWWEELKKQTIFFPAFVFTMYIVFFIVGTLGSGATLGQISLNSDGAIGTAVAFFLNFALIIGFMIVLLIVPGMLSKGGASVMGKATKWTNGKIRSYAAGTAFGGAAMIGRNTVGRIASRTLSSDKLRSDAQKTGGIFSKEGRQGMVARALLNRADKAQDYSFDARATKFGSGIAKKYGLGTAQSGWKSTVENKTKAYKERMEKEKKLYGFGEDLPNADKSKEEIKNMQVRDTLQKTIEADRRKLTQLQTSTKPGDEKKAEKLVDTIAQKEAKLAAVYVNQDNFDKERKEAQDKQKEAKDKQIQEATKLRDTEEKAVKTLKEQAEKETDEKAKTEINAQIKVREEALKVQDKAVKELQTEHDTIGVSPKEKHKQELEVATISRDDAAKELKAAKEKLKKAKDEGKDLTEAMKEIEKHEKALGEYETEVGRLMNRGADQYLKFAEKQRKSITNLMGASRTGKAAMEKLAKDAKKEWKEKGKAKSDKKDKKEDKKDTTATNTTPAGTPAPGSVAANNLAAADPNAARHS